MKSVTSIAALGICTTLVLLIFMLFFLENNQDLKNKMDIAQEIKFDQNLDYVSIFDNGEIYKVAVIAASDSSQNLKQRAEEIGEYIWRKYAYQEQFTELEIVYQANIGSGCHKESIMIECNVANPMQIK